MQGTEFDPWLENWIFHALANYAYSPSMKTLHSQK